MNEGMHRFVLSHNVSSGYEFRGEIENYVPETSTQNWILSYISNLTKYSSSPQYVSRDLECNSFFGIDKYIVLLKSTNKKDVRYFVENDVTIYDAWSNFAKELHDHAEGGLWNITSDTVFAQKIDEGIRLTEVSEKTKLFVLTDSADDAMQIHGEIMKKHPIYLFYGSCVDVVANIPKVALNIAICRCLEEQDRENFLQEIRNQPNRIVVDLTNGNHRIDVSIRRPEFSQLAFQKLCKKIGRGKAYRDLSAALYQNRAILFARKPGFLNYLVYQFISEKYPGLIDSLTISTREKDEMKMFAKKWENQKRE